MDWERVGLMTFSIKPSRYVDYFLGEIDNTWQEDDGLSISNEFDFSRYISILCSEFKPGKQKVMYCETLSIASNT